MKRIEDLFVREKRVFTILEEMVDSVFKSKNSLPKQVFQEQFNNFMFEEFDWAFSKEFWTIIQKLAKEVNDDFILTAVLNPNPVKYFHKEFNYYNWIKYPVNISSDDYIAALELGPLESPADAVFYNSYTVIWLSPSMKWAIWGERDYGICILGFRDFKISEELLPVLQSWRSIDETVLSWIEPNFRNNKLPKKIVDSLVLNYSKSVKNN